MQASPHLLSILKACSWASQQKVSNHRKLLPDPCVESGRRHGWDEPRLTGDLWSDLISVLVFEVVFLFDVICDKTGGGGHTDIIRMKKRRKRRMNPLPSCSLVFFAFICLFLTGFYNLYLEINSFTCSQGMVCAGFIRIKTWSCRNH